MTRRERLERKLEKRAEWAESRDRKAGAAFDGARDAVAGIPPGQPILVGHHSEKRHRAALNRHDQRIRAGMESHDMAKHHRSKADGLARQLDRSIYSDDPDAIDRLWDKIADLEAQRERNNAINAAWRKAKKPGVDDQPGWDRVAAILGASFDPADTTSRILAKVRRSWALQPYHRQPVPSYVNQNLGGQITNAKKRISRIEASAQQQVEAENAGGVLIEHHRCGGRLSAAPNGTGTHCYQCNTDGPEGANEGERCPQEPYCTVTFAEKPEREILTALKAAGFHWSAPSWHGNAANLPEGVL